MSDYQIFSPAAQNLGGQVIPTIAALAVYTGDARALFTLDRGVWFYADPNSALTVDNIVVVNRATGGRWIVTGAGAGVWSQVQKLAPVTGAAANQLLFSAVLNGDVDGWYYVEGLVVGAAAGDLYAQPNGVITNMRSVGEILTYTGSNTIDSTTTPKIGWTPTSGTDFTQFRFTFLAARNALIASRTIRAESESTRSATSVLSMRTVFWDEQVTNVTSLSVGSNASNAFGIGSYATLWKRPL